MPSDLGGVLLAALGAIAGWFANHWLSIIREDRKRKVEARLKFVERQIEELYGPLAALLHEGRQTFKDLLEGLGRNFVFYEDHPLASDELETWLYWTEAEFLPRNDQIKQLLKSKSHLVDGHEFPDSYVEFLNHCNSWAINHRRWKEKGVPYSWRSKVDWPQRFEHEALSTFAELKAKHARLLGEVAEGTSQ